MWLYLQLLYSVCVHPLLSLFFFLAVLVPTGTPGLGVRRQPLLTRKVTAHKCPPLFQLVKVYRIILRGLENLLNSYSENHLIVRNFQLHQLYHAGFLLLLLLYEYVLPTLKSPELGFTNSHFVFPGFFILPFLSLYRVNGT